MEELNGFQTKENKSLGFIKLYRSFMNWEWYDDTNTKNLFLHCLLRANYEDVKWHGIPIPRGSFLTSVATLKRELNLSTQNIKTALKHLSKITNEITIKSTKCYSIITVNNYDLYNPSNKEDNKEISNEHQSDNKDIDNSSQTDNKEITTDKNNKEDKEIKENKEQTERKKNFVAKSFFQKLFTDSKEFENNSHLKDSFIKFLEYKTAIKKQFKTESGVINAFKDFIRLSKNDENYARALVENAIGRNWQSIYDLSAEQKKAFKNANNQSETKTDWESRGM